jgi:hypothetical protein
VLVQERTHNHFILPQSNTRAEALSTRCCRGGRGANFLILILILISAS